MRARRDRDEVDVARVLVMESQPIVALELHLVLESRGFSLRDVGSRAEVLAGSLSWIPDVIGTELPTTYEASVEFVTQLRTQVGTSEPVGDPRATPNRPRSTRERAGTRSSSPVFGGDDVQVQHWPGAHRR